MLKIGTDVLLPEAVPPLCRCDEFVHRLPRCCQIAMIGLSRKSDPIQHLLEGFPPQHYLHLFIRGEICPCRQCRRQCKIFASGVNFSIFTHFLCFFLLKLLKLGEIDGVKFLAWKSVGVKFWTNSMSGLYTPPLPLMGNAHMEATHLERGLLLPDQLDDLCHWYLDLCIDHQIQAIETTEK